MDLLELGFRTLDEWSVFFRTMRPGIESQRAQAMDRIAIQGLHDPYLGLVTPDRIELDSARLRESLIAHSCTSRTRAILHVLRTYACGREKSLRVFASERLSPFAQRLRSIFPRFTGSEYLPLASDRRAHPRVMHQDVQALSFSDDSFDIYVSCEVLEHVPDMDRAISEAARILKPGGLFVGTVPFNMRGTERTIKRAWARTAWSIWRRRNITAIRHVRTRAAWSSPYPVGTSYRTLKGRALKTPACALSCQAILAF